MNKNYFKMADDSRRYLNLVKTKNRVSTISPNVETLPEPDDTKLQENAPNITVQLSDDTENNSSQKEWFQKIFTEDQVNLQEFTTKILDHKNADHFFELFDINCDGTLTMAELIGGLTKLKVDKNCSDPLDDINELIFAFRKKNCANLHKPQFMRLIKHEVFQKRFCNLFKRSPESTSIYLEDVCKSISNLKSASEEERYCTWLLSKLTKIADDKGIVVIDAFRKILDPNSSVKDLLTDRFVEIITEGSPQMPLLELSSKLKDVFLGSKEDTLKFLFKLYDLDGNGTISREELMQILRASLDRSCISISEFSVQRLLNLLWDAMKGLEEEEEFNEELKNMQAQSPNVHNRKLNRVSFGNNMPQLSVPGTSLSRRISVQSNLSHRTHPDIDEEELPQENVTFEQFRHGLSQHSELLDKLSISASFVLTRRDHEDPDEETHKISLYQRTLNYISNNISLVFMKIILIIINIVLGVEAASRYWNNSSPGTVVARFFGQILNFNSAIVLIFVSRHLLTLLRCTRLAIYLPIDQARYLHKRVAYIIVVASMFHTGAHVVNFSLMAQQSNFTALEYLFTTRPGIGWIGGSASITGWFLVLSLAIIFITSMPFVRRRGLFEIFYNSHHLFLVFEILLVLHGPNYWKWILAPGLLHFLDRLLRLNLLNKLRFGAANIKKVTVCQSGVVRLEIDPNRSCWTHNPGDYVFINIPEIAKNEWHPFTISSAPEQGNRFTLHIRALGNWTKKLHKLASTLSTSQDGIKRTSLQRTLTNKTLRFRRAVERSRVGVGGSISSNDLNKVTTGQNELQILKTAYIKGPYGSPSSHIFRAEHAVLIATGIGVTPYASILQSIFYRYMKQCFVCPNCSHSCYQDPINALAMNRVDFYWINRNHNAFEWFTQILGDLEDARLVKTCGEADEDFMGLHLFLSEATKADQLGAVALKMALDAAYKQTKRDMLSGLKSQLQCGLPDWQKEFNYLKRLHKGRVTVFFCGVPALARQLRQLCTEFDFDFRVEVF